MCEVSIRSTDKCQGSNNLLNVMCTQHSYEFWVNVQFITVKNSTLTQNFRIFNHFTLASFDNTVHIHVCCGLLLGHSYFYDLIKKIYLETKPLWIYYAHINK